MQTVTNNPAGTKPPAAPPRSLHEVCESAVLADCGVCWSKPGTPCMTASVPPAWGLHVARFGRAERRGLISGPELARVLEAANGFSADTVIYDQAQDGAR